MRTRMIGNSGLEVSEIGLGCNNFGGLKPTLDERGSYEIIHAALDEGVTFFDTSDSYGTESGSERIVGEALAAHRHSVIIATKFGSPLDRNSPNARVDGSRRYILQAVENSLRRLKTDYIDLYQYHYPDPKTPIEETLRTLDDLVSQGKVRYVGCSNFKAWQLVDAGWTARHHGFVAMCATQAEYNVLNRQASTELFDALRSTGMGLIPFFPLANGLLSGKYRADKAAPSDSRLAMQRFASRLTPDSLAKAEALAAFCQERGHSMLELAFGWLLAEPLVASVIAGATTPEQVRENARATGWRLTEADLADLDRLLAA